MIARHARESVTHLLDMFQMEYILSMFLKSSVNSSNNSVK